MSFEDHFLDNQKIKEEPDLFEKDTEHDLENREFLDNILDKIILDTYVSVNSGQHGIIGLFDLRSVKESFFVQTKQLLDIDESEIGVLESDLEKVFSERFGDISNDDRRAIKILKIFSEAKGVHEAEMQGDAYDIVQKAKQENPDKEYAEIPRIYFNKSVDLVKDPEIIKKLKLDKVNIETKAYIMAMDYYQGSDLAEFLYRNALADDGAMNLDELSKLDFTMMQRKVAQLKGVGLKSVQSPTNMMTPLQTYRYNLQTLLGNYSRKHGAIDSVIFEKLRNTVEVLNNHGFHHRDLHERNIFLCEKNGEIEDVAMLDFDTARLAEAGESLVEIYRDNAREYIRDGYIVAAYANIGR